MIQINDLPGFKPKLPIGAGVALLWCESESFKLRMTASGDRLRPLGVVSVAGIAGRGKLGAVRQGHSPRASKFGRNTIARMQLDSGALNFDSAGREVSDDKK